MDLVLTRKQFRSDGVFGQLHDALGTFVCETLEHAYPALGSRLVPKVANGYYKCERSWHELHSMTHPFETFEVQGVQGHSNILFHWGNYNKDSSGCILVGALMGNGSGLQMLTSSRDTFAKFMELQEGMASFYLMVKDDD